MGANPLNGADNKTSNILIDSKNIIEGIDLDFKRRDCAEARQPRKQGLSTEEAEAYLSDVQLQLSDPITAPAVRCEYRKLAFIAANTTLPDDLRNRAASLRDIARAA